MKSCSLCNQIYNDDNLNFCLNDGGILTEMPGDDAPPTIQMNRVRTTQPNWSEHEPSAPWGSQPLQQQQQNFYPPAANNVQGPNQTLPTVSLVLGILGVVLFCCYGGFPLGVAAMVTGFLGYQNANRDPLQYGGRSLAIAGMILGAVGFIGVILMIILVVASGGA